MASVGTFHAKTHLTQLLGRVAKGERITITNRGKPVAVLVPPETEHQTIVEFVVREMLETRNERGPKLGEELTLRQLREEGQRF